MLLLIIRHVEGRGIHQNFTSETGFFCVQTCWRRMQYITWHHNRLLFSHCENNTLDWCFHIMKITAFLFSGKKSRYFTTENVIARLNFCWTGYMDLLLSALYIRDEGISQEEFEGSFCLFVCLEGGGVRPTRQFFTIVGERLQKFHLCSAVMAIEQWGFFNVSHLLWHGPTVYNGHLRGPLTLTPIAKRWAEELVLPVLTTWSVTTGDRTPNPACEANALPLTHCGGLKVGMSSSKCIWYSDMTKICYISV